jgi:hypothetical protein
MESPIIKKINDMRIVFRGMSPSLGYKFAAVLSSTIADPCSRGNIILEEVQAHSIVYGGKINIFTHGIQWISDPHASFGCVKIYISLYE